MSVYSNQPLRKLPKSGSQHSLYTENSDHSDAGSPKKVVAVPREKLVAKEQRIEKIQESKNNREQQRLPQIRPNIAVKLEKEKGFNNSFVNDSVQRHALFNEKIGAIQIKEERVPKGVSIFTHLNQPKYGVSQGGYRPNQGNQFGNQLYGSSAVQSNNTPANKLSFIGGQSRTIGVPAKSQKRYGLGGYEEESTIGRSFQRNRGGGTEPRLLGSSDVSRGLGLGSSQGNRWGRSVSLGQGIAGQTRSFRYWLRHFHAHGSVMAQALKRFGNWFEEAQKSLMNRAGKISLFDSLDSIKLKMESYLQRRINLQNLRSDRPTAEWSQTQFMQFYGGYKNLLNGRQRSEIHEPFTLKKYKNCVFFGRLKEGKKTEGILHYFGGKCFEGKFKDDQKEFGLQIDDRELYLGEFRKGLKHGQGILKTSEALYVGIFTCGEFGLAGQLREDSTIQEGKQGKRGFEISLGEVRVWEGQICILKNSGGDIFIGDLGQQGEKEGEGLEIFGNGDIYIGRYQTGSPEGYGEYYWASGAFYRGQFLSGMRHGRGSWQMLQGDSYEGEYMNDKKNGQGTYVWKNGSKYIGNFQNDYRHGYGQMYWQDGRTYKGKWLNGIEKDTLVRIEHPRLGGNGQPAKGNFRTIQQSNNQKRKIPGDKLKSLYNPSSY